MLDRKRNSHNLMPDAPVDDDYLLEENTPDLLPQVAAIESTPATTVDSLYSPQLAAIETETLSQQDADIGQSVPIQLRRHPYEGEIWNRYVHGGDDD